MFTQLFRDWWLIAARGALAKEDIVFSRPQHTISSPDPEYQVKKDD